MVVIVISGQPGCGSTTTGKLLSEKLSINFFSVGHYFKSLDSGRETERSVKIWKSPAGRNLQFRKKGNLNYIEELQIALAKSGSIIIESKLGIRFLRDYADVKIWLKAPIEVRAQRVAKRDKIPLKKAVKILTEKEEIERSNFRKIYGFDFFGLEREADIVIDTSMKSPKKIVAEILSYMKKTR